MMRSLQGKMILSYLGVALLTVLVVSALIRMTSGRSLMSLVVEKQTASLNTSVQDYYTTNGSLDGFFNDYVKSDRKAPPDQHTSGDNKQPPDLHSVRGLHGLVDSNYMALLPTFGYEVGETVPRDQIKQAIEVKVGDKTVAWILPDTSYQFKLSAEEELFLQRTTLAIGLAALVGVLAAVAMGYFLAGRMLKPIRMLTSASQALARGDLNQQLPVTSRDELGQLTTTFNQMSADLNHADQQRKQLTADITHDLSTPLQIISGYIEMLEDSGVTLTPQRIEIIKTELGHLRRLVGDLSTLTQVESGALDMQVEVVEPAALLERVHSAYLPIAARQGIKLALNVHPNVAKILVDEGRVLQVLKNLVENALRYTPEGGQIELGAQAGEQVKLWIKDSGSGIDASDLPYVFDRFYQADKSRGETSGKLGLGLAICKALVTAQGGSITAESRGKGLGTTMIISFALAG